MITILIMGGVIAILLYSIILHELAHAKAAEILGDPTGRNLGRITLNPLSHLDPIGTLLPILLLLSGAGFIFGWAKPVPINPYNFRDYRKGMALTGLAGPITNLFLAWIAASILKAIPITNPEFVILLRYSIRINIILMLFNLIPIPPLDGSRILAWLLPAHLSYKLDQLERFGFLIVVILLMFPATQALLLGLVNLIYQILV